MASTRNANRRRRMLLLAPTAPEKEAALSGELPTGTAANKPVQKFRVACNAVTPIRLRVTGPGLDEPLEFSYETPYVIIGRSRRADLRLNHPDVSLRHTYLQMVRGRMYCVDLESRNGITHQSDRRRGEVIDEGEAIQIGPFHVHVINWSSWDEIDTFAETDEDSQDDFSDRFARVNVEVLNVKKNGQRFRPLEEEITLVGNAPGSHLRLKDPSMSKTHCALVRTAEALWCVDLLGRGGTRLNGADIRIGKLRDGDVLHVGKARLKIHYSTMDTPLPPATPEPTQDAQTPAPTTPVESPSADADIQSTPQVAAMAGVLNQMIAQQLQSFAPNGGMSLTPFSPNVPAATTPPALPAAQNAAERNVSEAFVLSLVNQFSQMQQQMFQQSQQSMMLLLNMFSSLHQNHMELIRDDLNRIHQITDELRAVQMQMAAEQNSATSVTYSRDVQPIHEGHEHVQDAVVSTAAEPAAAAKPPVREAAPAPTSDSPEAAPTPAKEEGDQRRSDRSGVRTHTLLSERLAELESERNSRWHKIMQTITGIGGA